MASAKTSSRKRSTPATADANPFFVWFTRLALALAVAITIARVTILETNISPFDVVNPAPTTIDPPRGAGPAEGLVLDLLACLPALLVLSRRALDPTFKLRLAWSHLPMLLLGAWTMLSATWASDKFSAAVSSAHWFAALVMLWAVSQSVRRWLHFRIVAALCLGMLLALAAHALYYKWVDAPDMRATLAKAQAESGSSGSGSTSTQPAGFEQRQFAIRVASNDLSAYSVSANTFGAQLMLLTMVLAGVVVQRWRDGEVWKRPPSADLALIAVPTAGILIGLALIPQTGSRTAVATVFMGAVALATAWMFRKPLHRYSKVAYLLGVGAVIGASAWVVGFGVSHGRLFHESLSFRWRYWIGAMRVFKLHWLVGIGWDNFSEFYVGQRLLEATEEPRDPHDFIVRFFTELGVIGGALAIVWLLRMARELTTPRLLPADVEASKDRQPPTPSAIAILALVCALGIVISIFASLDFTSDPSYIVMELLGRFGLLGILLVGSSFAAIWNVKEGETDDRPAPWTLYATLIGLALFLLHNTIDFSLFENGALFLFALLAGAAAGVRLNGEPQEAASAGRRVPMLAPRIVLAACAVAWVIGLGVFVGPVVVGESSAASADRQLRHGEFLPAAEGYTAALQSVPYNADYAFRAAQSLFAGQREFRSMIDRAVELDPVSSKYVMGRARMNLARTPRDPRDVPQIRSDLDRATALDPQNSDMWLDAAAGFEALGDKASAIERYQHGLDLNGRLDPLENDRLTDARVAEVKAKIEALRKTSR